MSKKETQFSIIKSHDGLVEISFNGEHGNIKIYAERISTNKEDFRK